VSWPIQPVGADDEVAHGVARVLEDVVATLGARERAPNRQTLLARAGDLARASLFRWWQASLQSQARQARMAPRGQDALERTGVLAVLATDLYTSYAMLRRRARQRPGLVQPRDWELQHRRGATRILDAATSLGGTLIKAGQLASVRGDLLPEAYVTSLAALQDRVPPRAWRTMERTLVAGLGRPLAEAFADINPQPVAAASLAQVHEGRLRDGQRVALKIQYPDMANLVEADLAAFDTIVSVLGQLEPGLRLRPILEHLRATLPLELDFVREVREMQAFRLALADRPDVAVPEVVAELSGPRVITMEFIDGIKITDRAELELAGIEPRAVARLLVDVYAEQLLQVGRLHADPHPGNLLVQPGPRLVLLDHGLTLELSPRLVAGLRKTVGAFASGDFGALAEGMAEAGFPVAPDTDVLSLMQLAGVLLGGAAPADVGRKLGEAVGNVPVELITVGRALSLLTGITQRLDPELDVLEIVSRYA
jgi:predicted unusual protein kinase regulating ubiquinone biosynthesis (AarF/ABC1/UbiB family)